MNPHSQKHWSIPSWFPLGILACFLVVSSACTTVSQAEKNLIAQQKYEDSQNPGNTKQEKYKKLMEAIRMAPKEPLYRIGLGDAYFKDGKLDKAEKLYLSAIKADPKFAVSYRMLGRLYMQKSQWNEATHYLQQALNQPNVINPVQLYNWLAYSEYRKGDLSRAEKAWLRALDIRDSDKIHLNLALIYKESNRLDLAQTSLLKALELNPRLPGAHFALGEIYYQRNKFGKAKRHLSEVINLEPLSEQARLSQEILNKLNINK